MTNVEGGGQSRVDAPADQQTPSRSAPSAPRRAARGVVLGCVGVLCFSGTAPATRVAAPVFGATTLTMGRILIAAVLAVVTLLVLRRRDRPGIHLVPSLLVMGTGLAIGYPLFLALAVRQVPAYHGAVVIGLVPAATAILACLRIGERPSVPFWIAAGVGFLAVLGFALYQSGGGIAAADGWLALAVLSCAVGYVEGSRVAQRIGPVAALCWAMILLAPLALAILMLLGLDQVPDEPTTSAWLGFGYAGVASMFVGSLAWYSGLAVGGTAHIGQLNLAQPFLAITWSAALLGEHLTWAVPTTAAVVLACMVVCLHRNSDAGRRARP